MKVESLFGMLVAALFVSCQDNQCTIIGTTTDVRDGGYVYLSDYGSSVFVDSAKVEDGKFLFRVPKAPEEDFLPKVIFSYSDSVKGSTASVALVFTQDSEVKYVRDSKKRIFEVHGSPYNDLFCSISSKTDSISHLLGQLDMCLKDSALSQIQKDSVRCRMAGLLKEDSVYSVRQIEANSDNLVGAYLLYINSYSIDKALFIKLLNGFPHKFSSSKLFERRVTGI